MKHGERLELRVTGQVREAHRCGHCGMPVLGDEAKLREHVESICPVAKAQR